MGIGSWRRSGRPRWRRRPPDEQQTRRGPGGVPPRTGLLRAARIALALWGALLRIALRSLNWLKKSDVLSLDDDVTAHPTLALMRRIFADAQAKLRVMVEENAGTGLRLDGELEKSRHPDCGLRAGSLTSSNNGGGGGGSSSASSTTSTGTTSGSTPSSSSGAGVGIGVGVGGGCGGGSSSCSSSSSSGGGGGGGGPAPLMPGQNSSSGPERGGSPAAHRDQIVLAQHDELAAKRLSTGGGSPVHDKRASLGDKSASPVEKRCSPVDRKEGGSPADRSPIDRRNGSSPCASPSDAKAPASVPPRRPCAPALEKTRLAGSGGSSVDSRSGSASPVAARQLFFQQQRGERPARSLEPAALAALRPVRPLAEYEVKADFVDGDARTDEDNEPPGPAPSSRPCSPGNPLGIGDPIVASRLSNLHGGGGGGGGHAELASARRVRLENERLMAEVARLRRLLLSGASRGEVGPGTDEAAAIEDEARYVVLEMELQHARETAQALRADRKRLRAEKFDLLNQMKALYGTLEDKERELRDFIRNYEQRMRENEASLGRMQQPGAGPADEMERERERWSLIRAARDEADRSIALAASLADKEAQLAHAHATIKELQRQLNDRVGGVGGGISLSDQESLASFPRGSMNGSATPGAGSGTGILAHLGPGAQPAPVHGSASELLVVVGGGNPGAQPLAASAGGGASCGAAANNSGQAGDRGSCSADSGVRGSSDRESGGATSIGGNLSDSTTDATTPKDCSPTLSPLNAFSRSMDNSSLSRSVEQLSSPLDAEPKRSGKQQPAPPPIVPQTVHSRSSATRGGTWGSISRVFARSRHRKATSGSGGGLVGSGGGEPAPEAFDPYRSWSPLTEEGYAEKLRLLREAASVPMERWRAPTVLAWLEVALGMPQYGPRCAENVKSGKVLLELSDAELEAGLGVTHPLHRKKLRLAIEEHRHPNLVRYPCIAQLGHTWVSSEWLPDLGLAQYAESFATNMVDARMLDHLSKKELEKLLGVTRKFHQASVVHGINLLRMLNYDRQALAVRRHNCEQVDQDPLVWTNQRFIRWARNIDLAEYADNLKDSGVHGALVVLEPSFTGDTMATALGIPPAKHMIRRHLTAELEAVVLPARGQLEVVPRNGSGGARPMSSIGATFGRAGIGRYVQQPQQQQQHHQPMLAGPMHQSLNQGSGSSSSGTIDRRRSSLRGSLSRALGLRPRSEKASPSSSSDTGSLASQSQYLSAGLRSASPPPPQLPPRPSTVSGGSKRHRRVKSIGDIEYMSSVALSTPV